MATRSHFLGLRNEIILLIIDVLASPPPGLASLIRISTPLKYLSAANRRLRQLIRPVLLARITLDNCPAPRTYRLSGFFLSSATKATADLSAIPGVCDGIQRFSFRAQIVTLSTINLLPRFDNLVEFIGSLSRLQCLTLCIDTTYSLKGAINASSGDILLRHKTIKTLHVSERFIHLLHYCPNVRNLAISRTPGELAYGSAFSSGQPCLVAPHVTQLEVSGIVLLCRVFRLISLSLEFPNTQVLRLTAKYTHCFKNWSRRVGENFKHVKVLAVSCQLFEQFIFCGPQNELLYNSAPVVGAENVARLAFENIATLEELWLEPDNIAR
ncbi:hypothetical protein DPSP01_013070 [Paraphaeosphaeria sporulosa]